MKQNKFFWLFLLFFTYFLFQNNLLIQKIILKSCDLFFTKLFPSLFPMMIISDCLIYAHFPEFLCKYLGSFFQKLFHTSSYGIFAFFLACFCGTPTNAYILKNLTLKHILTEKEASKILSFSFFSNPLFLYTMLSAIFPNQPKTVWKLLLLPYFVNILIGIFSKKDPISSQEIVEEKQEKFGAMLSQSIRNAMNQLLFILGSLTLFLLLNCFINPENNCFISGLLEISQGLNGLITLNQSVKVKEILATIFLSFGGLSIHLQIKGMLEETKISYNAFFFGRIKQTVLSLFLLCFLL